MIKFNTFTKAGEGKQWNVMCGQKLQATLLENVWKEILNFTKSGSKSWRIEKLLLWYYLYTHVFMYTLTGAMKTLILIWLHLWDELLWKNEVINDDIQWEVLN